jgi:hypothetical protein
MSCYTVLMIFIQGGRKVIQKTIGKIGAFDG